MDVASEMKLESMLRERKSDEHKAKEVVAAAGTNGEERLPSKGFLP
jgi:hypothetical protein